MSKFILSIAPILDSIALRYPTTEIVEMKGDEVAELKRGDIHSTLYEELTLSNEECINKIQAAWINFGIGQLELATDGTLYIKVPFNLMEQFMVKAINHLQECVKTLKPLDLARPATRMVLGEIINSGIDGSNIVTIINQNESITELSLSQWIYSEYARIYESDTYRDKEGNMKDLSDLIIVYAVYQVFSR